MAKKENLTRVEEEMFKFLALPSICPAFAES